ncbi:MAG: NADH-quinone oxidoreductase subunit J [Chloroflexi bacterium]|nr:NADH-quinone oxidoreductase subunit J [Chloroflexota bacterium]MBP8056588.1 NADH-quinone oxidoreductase subunit J [Chloroflexota bacterium]
MIAQQIIFFLISAATIIAALIVVTNKNLFHAALALMASFLGVAGLYILLDAGFFAAAQLLVYIGAISILIIFAIMLTRRLMSANEPSFNSQWIMALFASVLVGGLFIFVLIQGWGGAVAETFPVLQSPVQDPAIADSVRAMGAMLVNAEGYVLPFEVASVLLLGALIGAIVVAQPEKKS